MFFIIALVMAANGELRMLKSNAGFADKATCEQTLPASIEQLKGALPEGVKLADAQCFSQEEIDAGDRRHNP